MASLLRLLLAWRQSNKRVTRIIVLGLSAVTCLVFFTVAGGYSSKISTAVGDEVLVKSDRCGFVYFKADGSTELALRPLQAERLNDAVNYAQQCYSPAGSRMLDCNKFTISRLPTEITEYNASCPFQDPICRTSKSNIFLDTGLIDSNDHLGLNARKDDRVGWRTTLHCAPLQTEGYKSSSVRNGTTWVEYKYGSNNLNSEYSANYMIEGIDSQYRYINEKTRSIGGTNYLLTQVNCCYYHQILDDQD